ncbi:MAG: hypothetical protein ABFD51_08980 [Anaerolineaceae bacterium]
MTTPKLTILIWCSLENDCTVLILFAARHVRPFVIGFRPFYLLLVSLPRKICHAVIDNAFRQNAT